MLKTYYPSSSHPDHLRLGRHGEMIATMYLAERGYRVIDRNVRLGRGEIDVIAYDPRERMIAFVEVKTRTRNSQQYPIRAAVHWRKRAILRSVISRWVIENDYDGPGRIDVLCVVGDRVVEHIKDAGSEFIVE